MITLEARGVVKRYGGTTILDGLNLDLTAGGLFTVMGVNGSGKSTFLRLLALLEFPDKGEVIVRDGGRVIPRSLTARRNIVLVPDRRGLFNSSVGENAAYGLALRGVSRARRGKIVAQVLKKVGLWKLRERNALVLSNGEAQRLCLAMAMAVSPPIILLDEPTASLDPENESRVEGIIMEMKRHASLVVLVTHNEFQASRLADHCLYLDGGRIKNCNL